MSMFQPKKTMTPFNEKRIRKVKKLYILLLSAVLGLALALPAIEQTYDLVTKNGRVMDPETMRDEIAMENLARYIIAASFSQERMSYVEEEAQVLCRSKEQSMTGFRIHCI